MPSMAWRRCSFELRGIKENRFYIHTHLSIKPLYEERFARILTDFAPLEAWTGARG